MNWNDMVNIFKLDPNATIPSRNNNTDCGLDLYCLEDTFIPHQTTRVVKTGIAMQIPEGYLGKVFDRSSMSLKGLATGAGVIDPGYTGDISVVLHNLTYHHDVDLTFRSGYWVRKGDKIAQIVLSKIELMEPREVTTLWTSDRGNNGFGSSGK